MSMQLVLVKSGELALIDFIADSKLGMPKKLAKGLFCNSVDAEAEKGGVVVLVDSLTSEAETETYVEAAALAAVEG